MRDPNRNSDQDKPRQPAVGKPIDWYAKGQSRIIEVNGVRILVRYVGWNGRRGRIAITPPPTTTVRSANG